VILNAWRRLFSTLPRRDFITPEVVLSPNIARILPRVRSRHLWGFVMSERRKSNSSQPNSPHLIVASHPDFPTRFAGWFGRKHAKAAITAAEKAHFSVIPVETPQTQELATRLTEGNVEAGTLHLSPVDDVSARELDALIIAQEMAHTANKDDVGESDLPPSPSVADIWEVLKPGASVLAADLDKQGAPEAWYEAEIISLEGPEFMLRWRDFPRDGVLRRTRRHIAILYPAN
jgi:hypothetical protein